MLFVKEDDNVEKVIDKLILEINRDIDINNMEEMLSYVI